MTTFNDIINLAKTDGGKFFVMDEKGEAKLVIMSVEDYQKLLLGKVKQTAEDVEKINREIIKAQLENAVEPSGVTPQVKVEHKPAFPMVDMREEVIDPSFDFEGPKVEIDDL